MCTDIARWECSISSRRAGDGVEISPVPHPLRVVLAREERGNSPEGREIAVRISPVRRSLAYHVVS
jgi:hypothetical protein